MCLTQEACLRRNLVHVCPNPARKNSESSPQQRERGTSTKVCFHTAEPWGKWGARGPRDDCGLSGFFPRLAYMFSLTPGMRQKGTVQVPSSFFMSINPSSTNQRRCTVTAPPPPRCGMGTQSAALATVSTTAAWGNCGRHLPCPKIEQRTCNHELDSKHC